VSELHWEFIHSKIVESEIPPRSYFWRVEVPGGWLIRTELFVAEGGKGVGGSTSIAFYPDPEHKWHIV